MDNHACAPCSARPCQLGQHLLHMIRCGRPLVSHKCAVAPLSTAFAGSTGDCASCAHNSSTGHCCPTAHKPALCTTLNTNQHDDSFSAVHTGPQPQTQLGQHCWSHWSLLLLNLLINVVQHTHTHTTHKPQAPKTPTQHTDHQPKSCKAWCWRSVGSTIVNHTIVKPNEH